MGVIIVPCSRTSALPPSSALQTHTARLLETRTPARDLASGHQENRQRLVLAICWVASMSYHTNLLRLPTLIPPWGSLNWVSTATAVIVTTPIHSRRLKPPYFHSTPCNMVTRCGRGLLLPVARTILTMKF